MTLHRAANEHLLAAQLDTHWPLFGLRLQLWMRAQGFHREGERIGAPVDEVILPDYVRNDVRLKAGWDTWSNYYLLSSDEPGDAFLRLHFG